MRFRLCLLMFLQYGPSGAVLPLYSTYLQEQLGFTSMGIAVCCATQALATICAALVAGHVADRLMPAERLLGLCSLIAGLDLWILAQQNQPVPIFLGTLVYWLLTGPIWMLGATICLSHLKHPERQYGPVRLWGTVGWMASAWLVCYWYTNPDWLCRGVGWLRPDWPLSERADIFRVGGLLSFVLMAYTLTLPHTPPRPSSPLTPCPSPPSGGRGERQRFEQPDRHPSPPSGGRGDGVRGAPAPLEALRLLRGRAFFVYALCFFGACVTFPFGTQGTPLLLRQLQTEEAHLPAILTIAQATEVLFLGLLPLFLRRLGVRGTVLVGLSALTAGLAAQALAPSRGLVAGSLGFNGLVIAGVFVAGQVFVNGRVHDGLRASVQSLLTFISGLGMLLGNLLFGALRRWASDELQPAFAVGAIVMGLLVALFAVGFESRRNVLE